MATEILMLELGPCLMESLSTKRTRIGLHRDGRSKVIKMCYLSLDTLRHNGSTNSTRMNFILGRILYGTIVAVVILVVVMVFGIPVHYHRRVRRRRHGRGAGTIMRRDILMKGGMLCTLMIYQGLFGFKAPSFTRFSPTLDTFKH